MTNYEYIKNSDKNAIAELITALIVSVIEIYEEKYLSQETIDMELETVLEWLDDYIIENGYFKLS